jgi:ABC-2 type transport system ATP-binding protein
MEEAQRLCDRVAIMDHGKLLDVGTVDVLINRHGGASVVTAELKNDTGNHSIPGIQDGNSIRFESDRPLDEIARLSSDGVQFQTLQVSRPDLESVFLALTGRRLRD